MIVGLHILSIYATNPHQKMHWLWNLNIAYSGFYLFDTLHDNFHECCFDNLYMSAKIAYAYFTHHPKNIQVQVVWYIGGRGVPKEVLKHEVKDTKKANLVRWVLFDFIYNLPFSCTKFITFILSFKF